MKVSSLLLQRNIWWNEVECCKHCLWCG